MTDDSPSSDKDATGINQVLRSKYYDDAGVAWWWNNPNARLQGLSPHQMWLRESESSPETIELIRLAAEAAPKMGYAT